MGLIRFRVFFRTSGAALYIPQQPDNKGDLPGKKLHVSSEEAGAMHRAHAIRTFGDGLRQVHLAAEDRVVFDS